MLFSDAYKIVRECISLILVHVYYSAKKSEVEAGVDGFMLYDVSFIPAVQKMFDELVPGPNQLHVVNNAGAQVIPADLLKIPQVIH